VSVSESVSLSVGRSVFLSVCLLVTVLVYSEYKELNSLFYYSFLLLWQVNLNIPHFRSEFSVPPPVTIIHMWLVLLCDRHFAAT
jgi:hypothetical protein